MADVETDRSPVDSPTSQSLPDESVPRTYEDVRKMIEEEGSEHPLHIPKSVTKFLEVTCKKSGKIRRFAFGTEAGFAVNIINKKSAPDGDPGVPLASYLGAVKEGEIPIIFGPNVLLVNYGPGWKLQTFNDVHGADPSAVANGVKVAGGRVHRRAEKVVDDANSLEEESKPVAINLVYLGKILLAFILLFTLGAVFTLFLENLPLLLLYIKNLSV